jgi:hypothetical protein
VVEVEVFVLYEVTTADDEEECVKSAGVGVEGRDDDDDMMTSEAL